MIESLVPDEAGNSSDLADIKGAAATMYAAGAETVTRVFN